MRNNINLEKIHEQTTAADAGLNQDKIFYFAVISEIKVSIDDIVTAGRKISLPRIAQRMQLAFPGITTAELWQTYQDEITQYAAQYD